ncbi:MAG: hypothetical protein HY675_05140 [Chloroflexi bacterium]|nr:hypothetical protein [Chloroflexota bacterium]
MGDTLSWLALIFLMIAGYSAGATLSARMAGLGAGASPSLLDTAMVVVLWVGGFATRLTILEPWTAVLVWLLVAMAAGFSLNRVQPHSSESKALLP